MSIMNSETPVIETGVSANPNHIPKALCEVGWWKKTINSSFESASS